MYAKCVYKDYTTMVWGKRSRGMLKSVFEIGVADVDVVHLREVASRASRFVARCFWRP